MRATSLALLATALVACAPEPGPPPRPGRIVLVSLDTVRADLLAKPRENGLPELARLAEEGAHFTRAWSAASYTLPAHATLLTGRDPAEHPLRGPRPELLKGAPTLAERLGRAGYTARGFHEGGYLDGAVGFARGFARYTELPRRSLVREHLSEVLAWIDRQGEAPFFLFLHTYAAHDPYGGWEALREGHPDLALPSSAAVRELAGQYPHDGDPAALPPAHRHLFQLYNPLAERGVERVRVVPFRPIEALREGPHFEPGIAAMREAYRARIALADAMLGRLREQLEASGLWEDTLLVVTSDHGEAFFEHGQPWHGYVPYEEVLRVPWIVSWPRALAGAAPRAIEAPVWHLDLVPTLLGLAGLPPDPSLPGRDLSGALLRSDALDPAHAIFPLVEEVDFLAAETPRRVVIQGNLKWIPHDPRFHAAGEQLFDLVQDPNERSDLRPARTDDARRLAEAARDYEAGLTPPPPPRSGRRTPGELEALRELGYVD